MDGDLCPLVDVAVVNIDVDGVDVNVDVDADVNADVNVDVNADVVNGIVFRCS